MTNSDPQGDAARQRFVAFLDDAEVQRSKIRFWWRDDDAIEATPPLETLLALSDRHNLPLGLAVIPKNASDALSTRLAPEKRVTVLQHGWQHKLNNPDGETKAELGDHRPLDEILRELRLGRERLEALFPTRFLPVLVPPWNRIGTAVNRARHEVGLVGLSTYGPNADGPHCVNTHLDIFDWPGTRGPLSRTAAYTTLSDEMERRLAGDAEPIGILTHHLIHRPESWEFLEELFALTARHPALEWPSVPKLFALPSP